MTTIELQTSARNWALVVSLVAVSACGAQTSEQEPLSSETHFLSRCTDRCSNGLQCIAGVCTKPCESSDSCRELSANAECLPALSADNSCQVACSGNPQCRSENEDWACAADRCVASGSGPDPEPRCPAFEGGVQSPVEIDAESELIPGSLDVLRATADETGLYWIDASLAVFARPRDGDTEMISPVPAADPIVPGVIVITGFVSDGDTLYFADGMGPDPSGPPSADPPSPPGHVWALPKAGGEPTLVFESNSQVLYPLGVVDGELILTEHNQVFAPGRGDRYPPRALPRGRRAAGRAFRAGKYRGLLLLRPAP
jgi:hypothetical protein